MGASDGDGAAAILGKLKTLRVMRVVRPLRIISRSENLKIAINALVVSVPQMINLIIFVGIFFFLFGIFGVNYFKGCYYGCTTEIPIDRPGSLFDANNQKLTPEITYYLVGP